MSPFLDEDIDVDDPSFWEKWARKLNMDPKSLVSSNVFGSQKSSSSSMAFLDEPRIKRQARKIRAEGHALALPDLYRIFSQLQDYVEPGDNIIVNAGVDGLKKWTQKDLLVLLQVLLERGLSGIKSDPLPASLAPLITREEEQPVPKKRSTGSKKEPSSSTNVFNKVRRQRNFVVAVAKWMLRECLDQANPSSVATFGPAAAEEAKLKEDTERLVIGRVDFDPVEVNNDNIGAGGGGGEEMPRPREFARSEIPYPGATRPECLALKAITSELAFHPAAVAENTSLHDLLMEHARQIVLRVQLVELVRSMSSNCNNNEGGGGGESLVAPSSTVPSVSGAGPAPWWTRDHDVALVEGIRLHGYGQWRSILADMAPLIPQKPSAAKEEPSMTKMPANEDLDDRVIKLLSAHERRQRMQAKAALNTIQEERRRITRLPVYSTTRKRRRQHTSKITSGSSSSAESDGDDGEAEEEVASEESDEEEDEDAIGSRKRGGNKRTQPSKTKTADDPRVWSRRDRNEFLRVVGIYGCPSKLQENGDEQNDPLLSEEGLNSLSLLGGPRDWATFLTLSDFAVKRAGKDLDAFLPRFIAQCRASASSGSVDSAKVYKEQDAEDEQAPIPADRAKKALQRIRTFALLRWWLKRHAREDIARGLLEATRRTAGLPRWWLPGVHDGDLLQGIARYGMTQPARIIGDQTLAFWSVYAEQHPEKAASQFDNSHGAGNGPVAQQQYTASGRKKRMGTQYSTVSTTSQTTTHQPSINPADMSWPNEMVQLRRFELLMDIVEERVQELLRGYDRFAEDNKKDNNAVPQKEPAKAKRTTKRKAPEEENNDHQEKLNTADDKEQVPLTLKIGRQRVKKQPATDSDPSAS